MRGAKTWEKGEGVPPQVFCKRVRKVLMGIELPEYSFLKSAEAFENRGVNFWHFLQKSEKSEEEARDAGDGHGLKGPPLQEQGRARKEQGID